MPQIPYKTAERPAGAVTVNCCSAWFTGLSTAHCTVCHATFSTVGNFDRHRRNGKCVDPASILDPQGRAYFGDSGRRYPCWSKADYRD